MAPDCESPKCHEKMSRRVDNRVKHDDFDALKVCSANKIPKKAAWAAIPILMALCAFLVAAADFKYAQVGAVEEVRREQVQVRADQRHTMNDLEEIKTGQNQAREDLKDVQKDIKEILRHMRGQ